MPRGQSWIKLHSEDNQHAPIIRLSLATRAIYYALQAYTMDRCDSPGAISRKKKPIAIEDIALELHIDAACIKTAIEELMAADGLLEREKNGVLRFPDWNKRQSGNARELRDRWKTQKAAQRSPDPEHPQKLRVLS